MRLALSWVHSMVLSSFRIRSIPFSTLRPTFSEVKRVYDQLTKVELYRTPSTDFIIVLNIHLPDIF